MNLIFYKLKKLKKHEFNFLQAEKTQKTWIQFFESLKSSKHMNLIFCNLKKAQKTWV